MAPRKFYEFDSLDDAIVYRRKTGCGGWIFGSEGLAVLFPAWMTPSMIMRHPLTAGLPGELYC
jgi:hypothetical protein